MNTSPADPVELTTAYSKRTPRLSLVVPTYNVASYLPKFLESVFTQTSQTQRFEVIIVDDGSTDDSGRIAMEWVEKHPEYIRCIKQNNSGLSGARNTGLRAARGKWVSFPDPDDILSPDYFRIILEQTVVEHDSPLLMIVAKLLPFDEMTGLSHDNHPLDYRFRRGLKYIDTSDLGDFIHLSAASCWFDRDTLKAHKLWFNGRIKPVFEDGHFVAKLMMLCPDRTIAVAPKAVYHYCKRADASSLVMSAKTHKGFYLDTVEYGYLDLMLVAMKKLGHVPNFVQRTCLYEIHSRIKYLMGDEVRISILTEEEQARFFTLLQRIFDHISVETIQSFQIGRFQNKHRIALIARFKPKEAIAGILYIETFDPVTGTARFSYFTGAETGENIQFLANGRPLPVFGRTSDWTSIAGKRFLGQHWVHVILPREGVITCKAGDDALTPRHIKRNLTEPLTHAYLTDFLRPVAAKELSESDAELRQHLREQSDGSSRYAAAWLLMDMPMYAGGDATHLYEHLSKTAQGSENIWFVLSILSPDWARLIAAGFRLLPYGSTAHAEALAAADLLVTSCPDTAEHWPAGRSLMADLTQVRTVLLPQEIAPPKEADYLCAPSRQAATVAIEVDTVPRWFETEITVTGFARHDALTPEKTRPGRVVIAPDWMLDSNGHLLPDVLSKEEDIADYQKFWERFFAIPALAQLKEKHGPEFWVVAGRNLCKNPAVVAIADHVDIVEPGENAHEVPAMLAQADIVVTDQIALAFDAAYLGRKVILCTHRADELLSPLPSRIIRTDTPDRTIAEISGHYAIGMKTTESHDPEDNLLNEGPGACERIATVLAELRHDLSEITVTNVAMQRADHA